VTPASAIGFEHVRRNSHEILEVRGELDLTNADMLDEALAQTSTRAVIVDLAGLGFVDSTGMRAIDQAHRRLAAAGRTLLIVAPADSTAGWTFRIAGFGNGSVLESLDVALEHVPDEREPRL
jgi:anti-sigma B factor antagonist